MSELKQDWFTIDVWEVNFKGYTSGMTWNGWETPCFTLEESKRIMGTMNEYGLHKGSFCRYDASSDSFIYNVYDGGDDMNETIKGFTRDGIKLYEMGEGWTWYKSQGEKGIYKMHLDYIMGFGVCDSDIDLIQRYIDISNIEKFIDDIEEKGLDETIERLKCGEWF